MSLAVEDLLHEMTTVIVEAVSPVSVILFGSHARGAGGPASDVDLLIVKEPPFGDTDSRCDQMARIWRLLAHFPIPQDILVFAPEEVERWRHTKNHVIARARREGKVLYERP